MRKQDCGGDVSLSRPHPWPHLLPAAGEMGAGHTHSRDHDSGAGPSSTQNLPPPPISHSHCPTPAQGRPLSQGVPGQPRLPGVPGSSSGERVEREGPPTPQVPLK